CDFLCDDCSACSKPPDCPTLIRQHANAVRCDQELARRAKIACRSTGSTNDRAAECSCAKASDAQRECAGIRLDESPTAHASRFVASAACGRCALPCARRL